MLLKVFFASLAIITIFTLPLQAEGPALSNPTTNSRKSDAKFVCLLALRAIHHGGRMLVPYSNHLSKTIAKVGQQDIPKLKEISANSSGYVSWWFHPIMQLRIYIYLLHLQNPRLNQRNILRLSRDLWKNPHIAENPFVPMTYEHDAIPSVPTRQPRTIDDLYEYILEKSQDFELKVRREGTRRTLSPIYRKAFRAAFLISLVVGGSYVIDNARNYIRNRGAADWEQSTGSGRRQSFRDLSRQFRSLPDGDLEAERDQLFNDIHGYWTVQQQDVRSEVWRLYDSLNLLEARIQQAIFVDRNSNEARRLIELIEHMISRDYWDIAGADSTDSVRIRQKIEDMYRRFAPTQRRPFTNTSISETRDAPPTQGPQGLNTISPSLPR